MGNNRIEGRTLLFVEDNAEYLNELTEYFSEANEVYAAQTLKRARVLADTVNPDAIILDIILPDGEGLELLNENRKLPPVIILSGLDGDCNVLEGLHSGAADYVIKPCSPKVLEARLCLRLLPPKKARLHLHGLEMDLNNRTVKFNQTLLSLTGSEFNILHLLMANAGKFFTSEEIYEEIWKAPSLQTTTVKRHLSTLRCKLKEVTSHNLIITGFGKGYCMITEEP